MRDELRGAGAAGASGGEPGDILDRIRRATGYRPLEPGGAGLLLAGTTIQQGMPGTYELRFTSEGEFSRRVDSVLGEHLAVTGAGAWAVDWNGMPRDLELEEREMVELSSWLQTGWWLDGRAPLHIEAGGGVSGPGETALLLRHARGAMRASLIVDGRTGLPARMVYRGMPGELIWRYEDYKPSRTGSIPGRITRELEGRMQACYVLESVRDLRDSLPERPAPSDRAKFDPAQPPDLVVRRMETGHMLTRPRIDGQDVGWCFLDTGAGASAVSPGAASRLGLELVGRTDVASVFSLSRSAVRKASSMQVGPVMLRDPILLEMDLQALHPVFKKARVEGIVGFDVLGRCLVEIDLANDRIALHHPGAAAPPSVRWQEMILHQRHPNVRAKFEGGREGIFTLDLGAGGPHGSSIVFHAPAVEAWNLLDGRDSTRTKVGRQELALGTIGWLDLAGKRFEAPVAAFALGREGLFRSEHVTGNLGVEILRAFRIYLDYAGKRVGFVPNV